jgi:DNA-binding transcriptional LysR family regulator
MEQCMDSGDLQVFEAVARAGGITRAADALHTVQSNVTARVRLLERELGVQLFERHSRGVSLTSAGRVLLPYAEQVGRLLAEAQRAVGDTSVPRGPLRVGSLETTAARRLPTVLAAYSAAYPEVDVSLQTGTSAELIAGVLDYRLEGALIAGPVEEPALVAEPIVEEELVLVTAPSCPSAEAALAAGRELKLLVLRRGCSYRERLERLLAERGPLARLLEFGMLDAVIGCAAAGIGVTLLPRAVVEADRAAGRVALHALPPEQALVTTLFVRRRDAFVSTALIRFVEYCTRYAGEAAAAITAA